MSPNLGRSLCYCIKKRGLDLLRHCVSERQCIASAPGESSCRQDSCMPVFSMFCNCFPEPSLPLSSKLKKNPCFSLAGRVAAVGLSCLPIACHFLEGLYVPRATPVSPCIQCAHPLCNPVIPCVEQLLALTPCSL